MAEQIEDEGFLVEKRRRKPLSKDSNAELFWSDQSAFVDITKLKALNPKWGSVRISKELVNTMQDRKVKKVLEVYFYEDGVLYRRSSSNDVGHRPCVSRAELVRLMKQDHNTDHRKADTIYESLRRLVFPVVRETVGIIFKTEIDCDLCKSSVELPRTTRSRRSIPATYANSRWQIDLKKMPPSRGYNYVCNIIDCFSRFSFGKPIKTKTSKEVADVVINYIYLFGAPRIIQSDNGREFRNSDLAAVVKEFEAVQMHGRPYHPQSQGRVERFNRTMTEYFRIKMAEDSNWPASLPAFYYSYNNRVNKSTRPSTPYQLFYKRPNFAAPLDEKVPYATLTPEEQAFLSTAHLDVDGGEDSDDEDITIEEALEEIDANTATPMSMPTLSPMVECSFGEEAESPRTPIQRHTSEHPIPSMSPVPVTPVPLRAGAIAVSQVPSTSAESPRHTSEQPVPSVSLVRVTTPPPVPLHGASAVSQGSSTSVNNDASMQEDVSPYYKEIYRRRFSDRDSLSSDIDTTSGPPLKRRMVDPSSLYKRMYPLEQFSTTEITEYPLPTDNEYYPMVGDEVFYRLNPALSKGTAVFTTGLWKRGVCSGHQFACSVGHVYTVTDINTGTDFELNRHQIKSV